MARRCADLMIDAAGVTADRGELLNILKKGSEKARERAAETMDRVREKMHLDYDRLAARSIAK